MRTVIMQRTLQMSTAVCLASLCASSPPAYGVQIQSAVPVVQVSAPLGRTATTIKLLTDVKKARRLAACW